MSTNNNKIKLSNFLIPLNMYKNNDRKVAYDDNDAVPVVFVIVNLVNILLKMCAIMKWGR